MNGLLRFWKDRTAIPATSLSVTPVERAGPSYWLRFEPVLDLKAAGLGAGTLTLVVEARLAFCVEAAVVGGFSLPIPGFPAERTDDRVQIRFIDNEGPRPVREWRVKKIKAGTHNALRFVEMPDQTDPLPPQRRRRLVFDIRASALLQLLAASGIGKAARYTVDDFGPVPDVEEDTPLDADTGGRFG